MSSGCGWREDTRAGCCQGNKDGWGWPLFGLGRIWAKAGTCRGQRSSWEAPGRAVHPQAYAVDSSQLQAAPNTTRTPLVMQP